MLNQPNLIRDRVASEAIRMLEILRISIGTYYPGETEALRCLERPQQFDLAAEVAGLVMAKFGHASAPKDPRFDKTRRALAKKAPKPPRGLNATGVRPRPPRTKVSS